jgi:hypothetical protein
MYEMNETAEDQLALFQEVNEIAQERAQEPAIQPT